MIKELPMVDIAGNLIKERVKVDLNKLEMVSVYSNKFIMTGQDAETGEPVDVALPTPGYLKMIRNIMKPKVV
ncbi:hypothetical protein [Fructobacillus fructosus]|uniref:hypothetical protein n=1 Tax=Fructobacillus fructosus TaxID=1631 RepID=UPI001658B57A|nr:hypothetical protein [Fructobacillus fructosus]MBC9119426.1 hypothetical protein [Fructobacillus fructosus]MBD9367012.1 hypothetical protein [Leuconostoc mesenteroides]